MKLFTVARIVWACIRHPLTDSRIEDIPYSTWRDRRLQELAWPTLAAMCDGKMDGRYYARSVDRLWLDGGSVRGFDACCKLGWTRYRFDGQRRDGERYGCVTGLGQHVWASRPIVHPNCRCTLPSEAIAL